MVNFSRKKLSGTRLGEADEELQENGELLASHIKDRKFLRLNGPLPGNKQF